jgi:RNA polymerase sigma factor (sigma-70 family)
VDDAAGSIRQKITLAGSRAEPIRSHRQAALPVYEEELSFPDFYRTGTPGLVTFVMWLGARAEEGADVAQEAMTKAWQHWEQIRHPRAWVRITASREYCRRNAACREDPAGEIPYHLLSPGAAADETALLGPERARVLEALRLLPWRQRQVMAWTYDGYIPAEIAEFLELKPGTVRASLHKARDTLKHHVAEEGGWPW